MCFLWHNKLLLIHSLKKKYDFHNIVKKCRNIFYPNFLDFAQIFDKSKFWGCAFHPLHLQLVHHSMMQTFMYVNISSRF